MLLTKALLQAYTQKQDIISSEACDDEAKKTQAEVYKARVEQMILALFDITIQKIDEMASTIAPIAD